MDDLAGQLRLPGFEPEPQPTITGVVTSLQTLVDEGKKFSCIYADPPWKYSNQASENSTDLQYPTMTVAQICAEPVLQLVEDNAHLHLWTTNGFLFEARQVLESWGFTYKSCFVWLKNGLGMGNYWRVTHEFMLFGIRGKCPFRNRSQKSWEFHPRGRHSVKPDAIRSKVELVSPGPYLELYGRKPVEGWTVYGNEVSS